MANTKEIQLCAVRLVRVVHSVYLELVHWSFNTIAEASLSLVQFVTTLKRQ